MAEKNKDVVLNLIFNFEKGWSNHPKDPGGPTMFGITQKTLAAWRQRPVTAQDVRNLTKVEARDILVFQYLTPVRFDDLPSGLDLMAADYAVNSGPKQAVVSLQRILGVTRDGVIGAGTLAAIAKRNLPDLITDYANERMRFLQTLKTWASFGRGWTRRVIGKDPKGEFKQEPGVLGNALALAAGRKATAVKGVAVGGEVADPATRSVTTTADGKAVAAAGIGTVGAMLSDAAQQVAPLADIAPTMQYIFLGLTVAAIAIGLYVKTKAIRVGEA